MIGLFGLWMLWPLFSATRTALFKLLDAPYGTGGTHAKARTLGCRSVASYAPRMRLVCASSALARPWLTGPFVRGFCIDSRHYW